MESQPVENDGMIKTFLSYLAVISWLSYELSEIHEQDEKMNLYPNEKEIKDMRDKNKLS